MRKMKKTRKKKSAYNSYLFPRLCISLAITYLLVSFIYPRLPKPKIKCANSISCQESMKLKIENNSVGVFNNRQVFVPKINLKDEDLKPAVLGSKTPSAQKHIYVSLEKQELSAYDGDKLFMTAKVSTGKWGRTPTGDFTIAVKLRSTRMTGGSGADYYDLPNVPYVMFFGNDEIPDTVGFSFHGAYWHNNFGHPMSHGCINMKFTDIKKLYEWATPVTNGTVTHTSQDNPGTKVTIFGKAAI